jgi:hypothetical protein
MSLDEAVDIARSLCARYNTKLDLERTRMALLVGSKTSAVKRPELLNVLVSSGWRLSASLEMVPGSG